MMIRIPAAAVRVVATSLLLLLPVLVRAQSSAPSKQATATALMLSDIHLDPFADPGRVAQLNAAPASEWKKIFSAPHSVDIQTSFEALQQKCHSKGLDTSWALYDSALRAMRAQGAGIQFITVSGDLMAHQFDCKYKTIFPQSSAEDYRSFTLKTLDYVQSQLHAAFPGIPIYIALGNNDSDCGDYQLDTHSPFLAEEGKAVSALLPTADRAAAGQQFAADGNYSALLPAPIQKTRLLVLNDLFMAKSYSACGGKPSTQGAEEQLAWLRTQLNAARAAQEKVWVMGHLPPGVNLHSTVQKGLEFCSGKKQPAMFLKSEELADVLKANADVIALAVFGHTHMDEMRLLSVADTKNKAAVALKMIPSITPVHGNHPSFTLASIDARTAEMKDYRVIAAYDGKGAGLEWREEYDFNQAYGVQGYNAATLQTLFQEFRNDPTAQKAESRAYLNSVFTGGTIPLLELAWPQYACSLNVTNTSDFTACACRLLPGQR